MSNIQTPDRGVPLRLRPSHQPPPPPLRNGSALTQQERQRAQPALGVHLQGEVVVQHLGVLLQQLADVAGQLRLRSVSLRPAGFRLLQTQQSQLLHRRTLLRGRSELDTYWGSDEN